MQNKQQQQTKIKQKSVLGGKGGLSGRAKVTD